MRLRAALAAPDERPDLLLEAADVARCQGARRYRVRALTDLTALDPRRPTDDGTAADSLRAAVAEIAEHDGDADVERARTQLVTADL